MRKWRMGAALAGALLQVSCVDSDHAAVQIPAKVRDMMKREIPADAQIHVQTVGRIEITKETEVCDLGRASNDREHVFGIDSGKLFGALGQDASNIAGSDRQTRADSPRCQREHSVFIRGVRSSNRQGEPYELTLAVWQGSRPEAVWIGKVERPDGVRPDQAGKQPFRDGIPPPSWIQKSQDRRYQVEKSEAEDVEDLSTQFVNSLVKGK